MISLIYKIMGDINPFKKAVTQDAPAAAAKGGAESGKMMAAQFKAGIMKYIGLGALTGVITNLANESAKILQESIKAGLDPETFQILTKAAEQSGQSLQELQVLMKEFPKKYAEMAEAIRGQGGIISNQDVENLAQIEQSMREIKQLTGGIVSGIWRGMKQNTLNAYNFLKMGVGLAPVMFKGYGNKGYSDLVDQVFSNVDPLMAPFRQSKKPTLKQSPGQIFSQAVTAHTLETSSRAVAAGFDIMTMLSGVNLKGSGGNATMDDLLNQMSELTKLVDRKL